MKNKLLGMPVAIFLIGLLVMGGALAALVNYLSNQVEATATVESPIELKLASSEDGPWENVLNMDSVYGGDTVEFYIREENKANNPITTDIEIIVNEDGESNVCEEITSLVYHDGDFSVDLAGYCSEEAGMLVYRPFAGQTLEPGHVGIYKIDATFAQNAKGAYSATVQHMNPTTTTI